MTDAVLVGLIAAVPATVMAAAAFITSLHNSRKVDNLTIQVDGRLTQLLMSVGTEQNAVGHAAGVEAERTREK